MGNQLTLLSAEGEEAKGARPSEGRTLCNKASDCPDLRQCYRANECLGLPSPTVTGKPDDGRGSPGFVSAGPGVPENANANPLPDEWLALLNAGTGSAGSLDPSQLNLF